MVPPGASRIWIIASPQKVRTRSAFCCVLLCVGRDHSGYGLSQWETTLQCNVVYHWLSPCPEWSLIPGMYWSIIPVLTNHVHIWRDLVLVSPNSVSRGQSYAALFNTSWLEEISILFASVAARQLPASPRGHQDVGPNAFRITSHL